MSEQNESTQERKGGWKQWAKAEARQVPAAWKRAVCRWERSPESGALGGLWMSVLARRRAGRRELGSRPISGTAR